MKNGFSFSRLVSFLGKSKWVLIILGLFLFWLVGPAQFIDSGKRGLRFTMGALDNTELDEGLNWKMPFFQRIEELTIQPQELSFTIEVGPDAAISSDNQSIGATITIFYKYKKGELVTLRRDVGVDNLRQILVKTATENFKQAIGKSTIFNIASNQEAIRTSINEMTKANMSSYPVMVTELKVINYDWSDAFEKQIEETMTKAQQVKQKEQDLLITEQEAQKQVKNAEAAKTAMITTAEGKFISDSLLAKAKAVEGEGIRKYNEAVQKNMELEIKLRELAIEQTKAEKWDGRYVPTNNYGPIPLETGALQPGKK